MGLNAADLPLIGLAILMIKERKKEMRRTLLSHRLPDDADLAQLDPWDLPPIFIVRKNESSRPRTHAGYWKEKEDEFTAIRSRGEGSSSSDSPSYNGVKRTLQFYTEDDEKTDWYMYEYQQLDADKNKPALFLQEDVVVRKVFQIYGNVPGYSRLTGFGGNLHRTRLGSDLKKLDKLLRRYGKEHSSGDPSKNRQRISAALSNEFRTWYQPDLQDEEAQSGSGEGPTMSAEDVREGEAWSRYGKRQTSSAAGSGESDVWQHFTKIHTKDPEVVYAACHRCDRVLKAHPKNGTSSLRRHKQTCTSHDPPCAFDQEILRHLRTVRNLHKQQMNGELDPQGIDAELAQRDPWDLQPNTYVTSSLIRKTNQGCWKEINMDLTAIRTDQLPLLRPQYIGLRRTLKFHHHEGKKMDWIMLEYYQVDENRPTKLSLQEDMVIRTVFEKHKYARELERLWNGGDQEEECYNDEREEEVQTRMSTLFRDCLLTKDVQDDQSSRPGKRKRTTAPDGRSEVWQHFTKINTTDPKRVYAVCHSCDRGLQRSLEEWHLQPLEA